MLLNETRGSHGMYSRAGRNTTEKFQILMRKDEILNDHRKKFHTKNIYTPDYNYGKKDEIQDDIEIFQIDKIENKDANDKKAKSKMTKGKVKKEKSELAQFLELKKNKRKVYENPSCTKYNPKYEFLQNKVTVAPAWDLAPPRFDKRRRIMRKRSNSEDGKLWEYVEKEPEDVKYYLSHTDFKIESKNFVELARQTKRGEFISSKYQSADDFSNRRKEKSLTSISPRFKKWKKIQAPDFRKTMSREQLDKVYGDKRTVIPFSFPNFKWTRPKPIVLVKYDQTVHKRDVNSLRIFKADNTYNPQNWDKMSKFRRTHTFSIDRMVGRPISNADSLPCYMRNIYSRQSSEMITEKALRMNNFAEGKFNYTENSFWPKKSFNYIINSNVLNSAAVKDYLGNNNEKNEGNEEINKFIQKSMKFYSRYY
jgi:hypothetical protein